MTELNNFKVELFDYFLKNDDGKNRKLVLDAVEDLAIKVLAELKTLSHFYQDYDIGNLPRKMDHCWVAFGPKGKKYREWAHQTISVNAQGIDVFINVETKPAIDRLRNIIKQKRSIFRENILNLEKEGPFTMQLEERVNKQASIYDYYLMARLESKYLIDDRIGSSGFQYIETVLEKIHLPYLSVRKRIERNYSLELFEKDKGCPLIACITNKMKAFHPLIRLINNGDSPV